MQEGNILTVALLCILVVPVLLGAFQHFSRERIQYSLWSLLDSLAFLFSLFLAVYLTRRIFFDHSEGIFQQLYLLIPENFRTFLYGQDIIIYLIIVPLLLMLLVGILRLATAWLNRAFINPLAKGLSTLLDTNNRILQPLLGALWQLPRAVFMLFIAGLLLNFYVYYFPSPNLSRLMSDSEMYQVLYKDALYPALNSNIAKKIPVLVNDSFGRIAERTIPQPGEPGGLSGIDQLTKGHIRIIEYFNGVTLDQAIQSTPEIDATARSIVGSEQNSKKKAYLLYRWVSKNIEYDYDKAARISSNPKGTSSGSIVAFNTRKGICFDYSSLYISMCRAVGLRVRLLTGLGYSGIAWGDHAWNQVYSSEEGRWINVDTTFGSTGNYFDKPDFNADHRYSEVQGEW